MVAKYFVIVVRPHLQWLKLHIKIHGMAENNVHFCPKKAGKSSLFLKFWLEFQL